MRHFRIRKHDDFQHYSHRNPPWIKLHIDCLGSLNFLSLSNASRWHAIACALLASRYQNHLPADPAWLKHELHSKTPVDLEALLASKFIVWCKCEDCASTELAGCEQDAIPETEQSREREEHTKSVAPGAGAQGDVDKVWTEYTGALSRFHESRNGQRPPKPTLTPKRRKLIRDAIKVHGLLRTRAAGQGIFLDSFHTGKNDRHKEYLKPEHAWRMNGNTDKVEMLSDLYFEWEAQNAGQ